MRDAVIGGGAAGITARTLHDAGRDVLLVEASDRLGGQARSLRLESGHLVDLGCGWLHSAGRNSRTRIAESAGLTVDHSRPNWDRQWRDLGYSRDEQRAFGEAWERWGIAAMAAVDGPDRPLSDLAGPQEAAWGHCSMRF